MQHLRKTHSQTMKPLKKAEEQYSLTVTQTAFHKIQSANAVPATKEEQSPLMETPTAL